MIVYTLLEDTLPRLKEFSSNKDQNVRNLYGERIQLLHNDPNIERIRNVIENYPKFIQLQTIEPGKLSSMLHFHGDALLLIDVRPRSEFVRAHIKCKNIICIDPASFKDSFTDQQIESVSLITSPHSDITFFQIETSSSSLFYILTLNCIIISSKGKLASLRRFFPKIQ